MSAWYKNLVVENAYGLGIKVTMFIGGVGTVIVFPLLLSPDEFGAYATVFALANFWVFFANFGLTTAVVKFVSAGREAGSTRAYLTFFSRLQASLATGAAVLLFASSGVVDDVFFPDGVHARGIQLGALYVFVYGLFEYLNAVLIAVNNTKTSFFSYLIYHGLRVILPVAFLYAFAWRYTSILGGVVAAGVIALVFQAFHQNWRFPRDTGARVDVTGIRRYMGYASLSYFGTLLLQWMGPLVIAGVEDVASVGFFRLGFMWAAALGLTIPLSSTVLFSEYARRTQTRESGKIEAIFSYSLKYSLIVAFFFICVVAVVAKPLISLLYGDAYLPAAPLLVWLSFLTIEGAILQAIHPLLRGIGRIHISTWYTLVIGVLVTVANYVAVLGWGIIGVAVSTAILRVVGALACLGYVKSIQGYAIRLNIVVVPAVAAGMAYLFIQNALMGSAPLTLLVFAPAGLGVAYLTVLYVFGGFSWAELMKAYAVVRSPKR